MAIYETCNQIINDAAIELGTAVDEQADVFASTDIGYLQLIALCNACGRQLLREAVWAELIREHTITTDASGDYALPSDWGYMIPQTNWNRTDDQRLGGPLSPQGWQYLEGRGLSTQMFFASFRIRTGYVSIYPQDNTGKTLAFEYVRNTWCSDDLAGTTWYDRLQDSTTVIRYPPVLFVKYLKAKYLEAKGFDSQKATDDYNIMFDAIMGQDKSAPILNAGSAAGGSSLLDVHRNIPDTGYGS